MLSRFQIVALLLLALIAGHLENCTAADWIDDSWQVEHGLADNAVDAITQTPDGYLWLGTQSGLARFDGVHFSIVHNPDLTIRRVRQLYVDRQGRLWVLGDHGEVAFIHDGTVKSFSTADGIPSGGLQSATENAQGQIWFSTRDQGGCYYFDGNRFINGLPPGAEYLGQFNNLAFDTDGTLYGGRLGELWKLRPGEPQLVAGKAEPDRVPLLCPSREGGFWMIAQKDCFLVRAGKWQRIAQLPYDLPLRSEVAINYEDSAGRLWVISRQRSMPVSITTNGTVTEHSLIPRPNANCRAFFEDREGNRWWSTGVDGVHRLSQRQIELIADGAHLFRRPVLAVAADREQGIWVLNGHDLVRAINMTNGAITPFADRIIFPTSLLTEPGAVWVGANHTGLYRITGTNVEQFRDDENTSDASYYLSSLFRDAQGDLLVGSTEGLFHFTGNKMTRVKEAELLDSTWGDFRVFAQDHHGRLYAGLRNGGLLLREGSQWSFATESLPGDDVEALWCDADDTLWIALAGHGLCRLKNAEVFSFNTTHVRLPQNIYGMIEDDTGFLWLTSAEGIFRVSRAQLNAVADGRTENVSIRSFDKSDGMVSAQCTSGQQPVITRSSDGKLWFATMTGLYMIDPSHLPQNDLKPPVIIEEVLIDDHSVWRHPLNSSRLAMPSINVPPNNARVEFRFTALNLSQPQRDRFRFQLKGLNPDWVEADTQRIAYYTRVPAGDYHFQVIACNNDGVWNETGATIAITVLPHVWQTLWFRSLILIAFALLLFAGYRRRVRGLEQERALQHRFSRALLDSQEQERQRIAAELHDSLGQSLLAVKNYATMALKEPTLPEKTQKQLHEISNSASASIEEVRSIARALRPYQLDRFGLTKTLEDTTEMVTRAGALQITSEIENIDSLFSSDAEISIYRIAQESLNNVIKHSRASTARFEVRKSDGLIRMTLQDDGVGFDYDAVMHNSSSGFGLANLRERVRLLGGIVKIDTALGKGTRLTVDIPYKSLPSIQGGMKQ